MYLNILVIIPFPNKIITYKIYFFNCEEMTRRIKTSGSLIMMGKLVPVFMPFQMRRSLKITERILCPWEERDMLKSNIKMGGLL